MNKDEIKASYSMRDIVGRYGLVPNRSGFIRCPFHSEKTASMKIYKDSYHCFGCGENGDIFTFEQKMNNLTFGEAFEALGGTYEHSGARHKFSTMRKIDKAKREREEKLKQAEKEKQQRFRLMMLIDSYRNLLEQCEPMSELWCYCQPRLEYLLYRYEEMEGGEATCGGWRINQDGTSVNEHV